MRGIYQLLSLSVPKDRDGGLVVSLQTMNLYASGSNATYTMSQTEATVVKWALLALPKLHLILI